MRTIVTESRVKGGTHPKQFQGGSGTASCFGLDLNREWVADGRRDSLINYEPNNLPYFLLKVKKNLHREFARRAPYRLQTPKNKAW